MKPINELIVLRGRGGDSDRRIPGWRVAVSRGERTVRYSRVLQVAKLIGLGWLDLDTDRFVGLSGENFCNEIAAILKEYVQCEDVAFTRPRIYSS